MGVKIKWEIEMKVRVKNIPVDTVTYSGIGGNYCNFTYEKAEMIGQIIDMEQVDNNYLRPWRTCLHFAYSWVDILPE